MNHRHRALNFFVVLFVAAFAINAMAQNAPPTTFTVFKDFTDNNAASVQVTLSCTSATIDQTTKPASEGSPAVFNLTNVSVQSVPNFCTAFESVPPGYSDSSNCNTVATPPGSSPGCTIVNTPHTATITVFKDFLDDNPASVPVTLSCTNAIIDQASKSASQASPAVFNLTQVVSNNVCSATESVPSGYTADQSDCTNLGGGGNPQFFGGVESNSKVGRKQSHNIVDDCTIVNTPQPATFVVNKDFEDDNPAPVQVTLNCTDATIDQTTKSASEGSPAKFSLTNVKFDNQCTATESVPAAYVADESDCVRNPAKPGSSNRCSIVNSLIRTTFKVFKEFSDDSQASVQITLACTDATVDQATKLAAVGSPAIFNLSDVGAENECTAMENVPAGYTADVSRCDDKRVAPGKTKFCTIVNTAVSAGTTVTVNKDFSDDNPAVVQVTLECTDASIDEPIKSASEGNAAVFNLIGAGVDNECTATETVPEGYVADESDCNGMAAGPGNSVSCQITNTPESLPLGSAIFTVRKDFSDDSTAQVLINLMCTGAIVDQPSRPASEANPAVFTLSEVAAGNSCTATETVPDGYAADQSDCVANAAGPDSSGSCQISNQAVPSAVEVKFVGQQPFEVDEKKGKATITIERTGGSGVARAMSAAGSGAPKAMGAAGLEGPLTVFVVTDDDNAANTAVAGEDYVSTRAEVHWADGEGGTKPAEITIIDNEDGAGPETVVLQLQSSTGEVLGEATLEIKDLAEAIKAQLTDPNLPINQQGIAAVIGESCPKGIGTGVNHDDFQALCGQIVGNSFINGKSSIGPALSAVTPDDAAAVRSSGMQTSNVQVTAVDGRLGTLRGGGGAGFSASGFSMSYGDVALSGGLIKSFLNAFDQNNPAFMQTKANQNADSGVLEEFGRWGAWISGRLVFGEKDPTTNQVEYDFNTAGLTFGLDYRFTEEFVAGVAVGYSNTDVDLGVDGGELDTDGYSVSVYGTYFKSESFYLGGSIGYGGNDYDQTRIVRYLLPTGIPSGMGPADPGSFDVDQNLGAKYDGTQFEIALNGGWDFNRNGWTFGPTFRVNYVEVDVDAYDETLLNPSQINATTGWAVRIFDQNYKSLQLSAGFEFSNAISRNWGVFVPQGYIDVVTEVKDGGSAITGQFLGDGSNLKFTLQTDDFEETFARAGLGFGLVLKNNKSAFLMVDADLGRDLLQTYFFNAGFRWQF